MEKLKNKFILFIIWVIVFILGLQIYITYALNQRDTNSYVFLVQWQANLNNIVLIKEKKVKLNNGDILSTKENTLAVIEWWDGSVTRIGENTVFKIRENFVSKDYSQIRIWAELISWKAWSKVVSMLGEKSYFTLYFNNLEAGVRGTTFDVDLEKAFIYVKDHELSLKKESGEQITIAENKPFSLSTFSFVELQEFLNSLRDTAWEEMNISLDNEWIKKLQEKAVESMNENTLFSKVKEFFSSKEKILSELQSWKNYNDLKNVINKLSPEEKKSLYNELYTKYQGVNFASYQETDVFAMKMNYRDTLISLADNQGQKELFMKYTFFDLKDIVNAWDTWMMDSTFTFLKEHKDILKGMNINLSDYIDIQNLPQTMMDKFNENKAFLEEFLGKWVDWENFKIESITDINQRAQDTLQKWMDGLYNIFNKK
jgi:hypothetical protein